MNMRLGACVGADRAAFAKNSGCDYIEMNFASVARMTDDAFLSVQRQLCNADIRAEAMNCFIPADQFPLCRLTAEDLPALCDFIETGMRRARQIGTKIAVFGSGGARRLPEGFTKQDGWHMLAPYFRTAGEIGWKYGIQIAIEPLCASECNAVNTVDDALAFGAVIAHANVGVLADLYHVCKNGETFDAIRLACKKNLLWHCHIARLEGRVFPMPRDGQDYTPFFKTLRTAGYTGRLSIEAKAPNGADDLKTSVAFLRQTAV